MAKVGTSTGRGRAPGGMTFSWNKNKKSAPKKEGTKKPASKKGH